jgi:hypothetical protein
MIWTDILLLSVFGWGADTTGMPIVRADDVIAKLIQRDQGRQAALNGYTSLRKYILENEKHHKRAEMVVRVTCRKDGSKEFEELSSTGWGSARKHVFPRLLEGEAEASRPGLRDQSHIGPENYSFELVGSESVNGRPAYVIAVSPKESKKYLIEGKLWVDAEDFAIVKIEGKPAKSPSFWIKSTRFVHEYDKHGQFWFPASDRSRSDARFFGTTDVTIEYFDYVPDAARRLQ